MAEGFRRFDGGILGLLELSKKELIALEGDLIRNGLRLRDAGSPGFTLRDLKAFVKSSPHDSMLAREMHPKEHMWTHDAMLLAAAIDYLAILAWQNAGGKRRKKPDPIPRPGVEAKTRTTKGEAIPIDKFRERLEELRNNVRASSSRDEVRRVKAKKQNGS